MKLFIGVPPLTSLFCLLAENLKVSPRILPKIIFPADSKLAGKAAPSIPSSGIGSPLLAAAQLSNSNSTNSHEPAKATSSSKGILINKHATQMSKAEGGNFSPHKLARSKTTRMDRPRDRDGNGDGQDALDISCDSLESLFITGTAPNSLLANREFSAKHGTASRMSSKRNNSAIMSSANTHSTSLIVYSGPELSVNGAEKMPSNAEVKIPSSIFLLPFPSLRFLSFYYCINQLL